MIIYLDKFFIQEFIMTYITIMISGKILKMRWKIRNAIKASLVTTIITFLMLVYDIPNNIIMRILNGILIVGIVYNAKNNLELVYEGVILSVVTFFIGGIKSSNIKNNYELIFIIVISFASVKQYLNYYKKQKWKIRNVYKMSLQINNHKINLKAFLDTGNLLTYGIKAIPIIIVEKEKLYLEIGKEKCETLFKDSYRKIDMKTINSNIQNTNGIIGKNIEIFCDKQKIYLEEVLVIASDEKFEDFDSIIGLSVLEGGMKIGNINVNKEESKEFIC